MRHPSCFCFRSAMQGALAALLVPGVSSFAALTNQLTLAADALSLTHGAAVSVWADTSGFERDAVQTVPVLQPSFATNVLNGLPVVRFDGVRGGTTRQLVVDLTSDIP